MEGSDCTLRCFSPLRAVAEANWLPKVGRQHQTGPNAYGDLLRKIACLVVRSSSRAGANILSLDLDDWPAEAVEVVVVIFDDQTWILDWVRTRLPSSEILSSDAPVSDIGWSLFAIQTTALTGICLYHNSEASSSDAFSIFKW